MPRAFLLKSKKFRSYRFQPVEPGNEDALVKITHHSKQSGQNRDIVNNENALCLKKTEEHSAEFEPLEVESCVKFPESSQESLRQPHAGRSISLQI